MNSNQYQKTKWRRKLIKYKQYPRTNDNNFRSHHPMKSENWDKEIEEYAKEKDQPPYADPRGNPYTTEIISCDVQDRPGSNQDHYSPAVHHTHPVKWVRCIYAIVADQFADAEE